MFYILTVEINSTTIIFKAKGGERMGLSFLKWVTIISIYIIVVRVSNIIFWSIIIYFAYKKKDEKNLRKSFLEFCLKKEK